VSNPCKFLLPKWDLFWLSSINLDFSVAVNRGSFKTGNNSLFDPNLGFIAFGGIAPVPVTDINVTVPIQGYNATTFHPENGTDIIHLFYTVDVEWMSFAGNEQVFGTTNSEYLRMSCW
jgi:hypothetical protein